MRLSFSVSFCILADRNFEKEDLMLSQEGALYAAACLGELQGSRSSQLTK